MTGDETRLLTSLLSALHTAVYGYGVLGSRLAPTPRTVAQDAADAHRTARDRVGDLLRAAGTTPAAPPPTYDVQAPTSADALALAVSVEAGLCLRYRDLVTGTDDPALRRLAVDGLSACAVRAATWRRLLGVVPGTEALPGTA